MLLMRQAIFDVGTAAAINGGAIQRNMDMRLDHHNQAVSWLIDEGLACDNSRVSASSLLPIAMTTGITLSDAAPAACEYPCVWAVREHLCERGWTLAKDARSASVQRRRMKRHTLNTCFVNVCVIIMFSMLRR